MSKFKKSAGGFGEDFIWSQVEKERHNFRVKADPQFLINIVDALKPVLEDDISKEIIKHINSNPRPKLGAKREMENELIVDYYNQLVRRQPDRKSKNIREELALKFKRSNGESIRKLLEKEGTLPSKAKNKK